MALLTSADYPSIRAAIDITLDSTAVPDSIIALDLYSGAGMRDVLLIDPDAETRTEDELLHAQTAAVLFTAARLVRALPQVFKETFPDHSYERNKWDAASLAAALVAAAGAELDAYLEPGTTTSDRPTFFAVAHGRRGRW